jgi:hypothetical protein
MKSIADKKRKENIIEYILYLYRMEDLLRAYQFGMEDIDAYVLGHEKVSTEDKLETKQWLSEMSSNMLRQGIRESGHLKETQELIDKLARIHWQLLREEPEYLAIYRKTQAHLLRLINETGENIPSHEVQIFINTLYGVLLSKLNGRKVPEEIMEAATSFGEVLAYINYAYMSDFESKSK